VKLKRTAAIIAISALSGLAAACAHTPTGTSASGDAALAAAAYTDWAYHGGDKVDRYSPLTQITPANVTSLKEAWRFPMPAGGLQTQPMKIGDTIYVATTERKVAAIDAVTGQQKWLFDPQSTGTQPIRGLTSWRDGDKLRIVFGREHYLYLIDAATGTLVPTFGQNGRIDVRENLRGPATDNNIYLTSPTTVYQDLLIVNGRMAENSRASPGDVRAFDARTGKPGEVGADTWPKDAHLTQGAANAWAGSSIDHERGIVFVNTGSPADDFYGANRLGDNRFANSTIALDARNGKRIWDFQQVHHDLWDSDSTSPPLLTTVTKDGRKVDVAVAWNKAAYIYVFNRETGEPIFPIVETPVPPSNVPDEVAAKTQPIPTLPAPISRKTFTVDDLTTASPEANAEARALFAGVYMGVQPFIPLALNQNTLLLPGYAGAWGGMAADREGVIYLTALNTVAMSQMIDNRQRRIQAFEPGAPRPNQNGVPLLDYTFTGYGGRFALKDGSPALDPAKLEPTMHAIDLNTGQYRWTVPLPNRFQGSGPLITATGLLFISAGNKLQAFATRDGAKLWEQQLPGTLGNGAGSYMANGKQYIVLASGGGATPAYVAYTVQ
jgi:quinoprotein glucose dehydrogenase